MSFVNCSGNKAASWTGAFVIGGTASFGCEI